LNPTKEHPRWQDHGAFVPASVLEKAIKTNGLGGSPKPLSFLVGPE
jgi:hypothetical protein